MTIKLIADPVYTRIFNLSIDDFRALQNILYYMSPGYFFSPAYQSGRWDGTVKLIQKDKNNEDEYITYTGLVYKVLEYFKEKNIEYQISKTYDYNKLKIDDNQLQGIELRDYQIEAINEFKKKKRGVISLPTGSGKTVIFIKLAIDFNLKTLIVLNRNTLVEQTFINFKKYVGFKDNELNVIGGSRNYIHKNNLITIATYQSLLTGKYDNIIQDTEFIIQDETHHISLNKIGEIAGKSKNALVRVGMCLFGGSKIKLSNGKYETIKNIFYNKKHINVITYNENTKKLESKPIVNFFKKIMNKNEYYYKIKIKTKYGSKTIKCSSEHKILTNNGWKMAKNILKDDKILQINRSKSGKYNSFILKEKRK